MSTSKPSKETLSATSSENDEPKVKKLKRKILKESDEEEQPKPAKESKIKKAKKEAAPERAKKEEKADAVSALRDDEGNEYFDLGRDRRASMSSFKGKYMVNIREYFMDKSSGKMKPGKKGITLNRSEWNKLLAVADNLKFPEE